jgi:drug/metabolite transporter (DMT)-like permease
VSTRTSSAAQTGQAARTGQGGAGLTIALLSAATFGSSGTFASSLIAAGWSPAAAVSIRIGVAALLLTVPALIQLRGRWRALRAAAGQVTGYGLIGVAGCQFCYFNALQRMPVGVALLLEYLGAVLVVGWLWLRHGQRPRRLTVAGTVLAITGLALVLNLSGPGHVGAVGVLWGLLAAASLAIYFVLSAAGSGTKRAAGGSPAPPLPPIAMAWAGMCVGGTALGLLGLAGAVPMAASTRDVVLLGHQVSWVVPVLGVALLATVLGYVTGISAARRLGAKLASFVGMAEVLFAIGYAWLLLHQLPSAMQFAGGAFIFTGVALVRVDELHDTAPPARRPGTEEAEPTVRDQRPDATVSA